MESDLGQDRTMKRHCSVRLQRQRLTTITTTPVTQSTLQHTTQDDRASPPVKRSKRLARTQSSSSFRRNAGVRRSESFIRRPLTSLRHSMRSKLQETLRRSSMRGKTDYTLPLSVTASLHVATHVTQPRTSSRRQSSKRAILVSHFGFYIS